MLEVFWKNLGWFDFTDRYIDIFGGQPFLYELKSGELKLLRKATEDEKNVECDWEWNPQFEFLPAAFRVVISKYPEAKETLETFLSGAAKYRHIILKIENDILMGERIGANFFWTVVQDPELVVQYQNSAFDLYREIPRSVLQSGWLENLKSVFGT